MKIIKCVDCKGIDGDICGFPINQIPVTCEMMRDVDAWVDLEKNVISTLYTRYIDKEFKNENR